MGWQREMEAKAEPSAKEGEILSRNQRKERTRERALSEIEAESENGDRLRELILNWQREMEAKAEPSAKEGEILSRNQRKERTRERALSEGETEYYGNDCPTGQKPCH